MIMITTKMATPHQIQVTMRSSEEKPYWVALQSKHEKRGKANTVAVSSVGGDLSALTNDKLVAYGVTRARNSILVALKMIESLVPMMEVTSERMSFL